MNQTNDYEKKVAMLSPSRFSWRIGIMCALVILIVLNASALWLWYSVTDDMTADMADLKHEVAELRMLVQAHVETYSHVGISADMFRVLEKLQIEQAVTPEEYEILAENGQSP